MVTSEKRSDVEYQLILLNSHEYSRREPFGETLFYKYLKKEKKKKRVR